MSEFIRVDVEGTIATITLDRPDKLNALTLDMLNAIDRAAQTVAASDARIMILHGEGSSFSAGMDLESLREGPLAGLDPELRYDAATLGRTAAAAISSVPQVSLASLHGNVVGGGVVLAAACDLRVADRSTVFSIPEIDVGIPLAWGGIEALVADIGAARTKEVVVTGRTFTADEALAWGLLNDVVEDGMSHVDAMSLAHVIASKARFPITTTKRHVGEVVVGDHSRDDALGLVAAFEDPESAPKRAEYLAEFDR